MNRISKDDIRTLIVVIAVCTVCTLLVVILSIKSNSDKLKPVNEYNTFFSATSYVNMYLTAISNKNTKIVYDLLDESFKIDNDINEDNLFNIIEIYSGDISINASKIEYVKVRNNYIYYVKGKIIENIMDEKKEIYDNFEIIVMTDFNNLSVSLYPIKNKNYKKIVDSIKKVNIEKNDNNIITNSELITKEQICVIYLSDYLDKIINDFDLAYKVLSDDMKKKYLTKDSYKEYVNNNMKNLTTVADKCKLEEIGDNRIYTVIDKNDNSYIFTEETIMNYKIDVSFKQI